MNSTPFDSPSAVRMAVWTLHLLTDDAFRLVTQSDQHIFALSYAACAAAVPPPSGLTLEQHDLTDLSTDKMLNTLKDLSRQFGEQATGRFASLYVDGCSVFVRHAADHDKLQQLLEEWKENAQRISSTYLTSLERNLDRLQDLIGLSDAERDLLHFQVARSAPGFRHLYEQLSASPDMSSFVLLTALGLSTREVAAVLHPDAPLIASGLLTVRQRPFHISRPSDHLSATLKEDAESNEDFIRRFVRPLRPAPSTASLARFDDRDSQVLRLLLDAPLPDEHGLHVLVYGPRTIDKRDLVARLLKDANVPAFVVQLKDVPSSDIPAWVHIAERCMTERDDEPVLVIERTELALASHRMSMMSLFGFAEDDDPEYDERASDEGLTAAPVRCIWLTDQARTLSERNLGRFLFHCEARPGSRADRRDRIAAAIKDTGLGSELENHLAKYSLLAEQPVRQAARLADLLHAEDETDAKIETIRRAVHQSQRVLGRDALEELRESVTHYDLSLLNLASRFTPEQIVASLKARRQGSLLFHGIPGAGKTQFAEYLAVELDMPLLMKRASDILSKWLGESEQHIAAMFHEAEEEGAILFIDEADSFLRDRSLAHAEWNVTQVNELLQHLERSSGIVVCATNLMRDIDAAAMRRFTFKIEFLPLKPEQSWKMFCVEAGFDPTLDERETESVRIALEKIDDLAPGDFATVKRMSVILSDESPMTPHDWLDQLAREAKDKMHGLKRQQLGFKAQA